MLDSLLILFEATTNGVGLKSFLRDPDCQGFITNEDRQCTVSSRHLAHTTPNALRSFAGRSHHFRCRLLLLPHPHTLKKIWPAALIVLVADAHANDTNDDEEEMPQLTPISHLRALEAYPDGIKECVRRWTKGNRSRTVSLIVSLCREMRDEHIVEE